MRDAYHNQSVASVLAPAARTSTATGETVDLLGYGSATFIFDVGVATDGVFAFTIEESANDSDWTTVAAGNLLGTAPTVDAAGDPAEDEQVYTCGYAGSARYVRAKCTVTGSPSTGAVFAVSVVRGHPHVAPVAA